MWLTYSGGYGPNSRGSAVYPSSVPRHVYTLYSLGRSNFAPHQLVVIPRASGRGSPPSGHVIVLYEGIHAYSSQGCVGAPSAAGVGSPLK